MPNHDIQGGDPKPHLRYQLLIVDDLGKLPPVKPLINGLLFADTLAQMSGGPGSYKSFLAITMACCIAAKVPFVGHVVPEQRPVVYVAAEGASDMNKRILAWCEVWEVDPEVLRDQLFVLPLPIQLGDPTDVSQAIEIVQEERAGLLVLDTRARCTIGLDENSATAQGLAIEHADQIRRAAGCAVLGVHHTSRAGSAGRGSNAWDGAVWSDLRVDGGGLQAKVHCEKHKDVASGCDHRFMLRPYTVSKALMPHVPFDIERETLVVSSTAPGNSTLSAPSRNAVLDIIWKSAPPEGFTAPQVIDLAAEAGIKKSSVYNALKWAVEEGFIRNVGTPRKTRYVCGDKLP